MDRKTKESCECDTLSLKKINVPCGKRTIISEYVGRVDGELQELHTQS